MNDQIFETIETLRYYRFPEILAVLGALLVLIDYFFPTDWPAHLGYVAFAGSIFFIPYMVGQTLIWCLLISLGCWVLLLVMHRLLFRHYLENAPGTSGPDGEAEPIERGNEA